MNEIDFMKIALAEAQKAYCLEEVPVGALIVKNNTIISKAHNQTRSLKLSTKHAEIIALEKASLALNNERLIDCELFVTKEPCAMCAGAIIHTRIKKVFIGARDPKAGACGTVLSVCGYKKLNHQPEISFGILEEESSRLLKKFFHEKR